MGNPLNPLYEAVAWVFTRIFNALSPLFGPTSGWTWALTIVILVVLMRLIMVPLFIKQMHTTRAMTALAPQMTALRKKYKNDRQTLNQEMMKLYQQAGVNPLMGCLPVAAQLPMFFALFSVLRAIAEWKPSSGKPPYGLPLAMVEDAKHASILGAKVADKVLFTNGVYVPLHAKIVIVGAVLVSMATTYLTVRQSMKRGMMPAATPDNPMGQTQKYMVYIMPLFALSGLYWPFGLVLYWVTTNVWTLGQQYVLFRHYPQPATVGADATDGAAPSASGRAQTGSSASPSSGGGSSGGGSSGNGRASRPPSARGSSGARQSGAKSGTASGGRAGAAGGAARQNGRKPGGSAAGQPSSAGGGILRRFAKDRAEPEPEPAEPEVKLVRQQPQRQSRSKRSGKR